ncbi:hypothetical protein J3458_016473 [Metarhizium acridum]|uniref:uncharacterized protein n=1 Tax=Metarhizium acridum TaxID=92637 RepID=UPI001C6CD054|nr:hypothetical protein J3458_016473 [Metarhizium acridum]
MARNHASAKRKYQTTCHEAGNTIENPSNDDKCSDIQAEFIGFTVEGGPIVRFTQPVAQMPQGELLGRDNAGGSTFAFPRGIIRFETGDEMP